MNKTKKGKDKHPGKYKTAALATFVCLLLLAGNTSLFSQSVYVKATANRDKILIGEPIQLTLEAFVPDGQSAAWFPLDSIPHFDIIERGGIDTSKEGSALNFRQTILVTSFDSGRWAIPSLGLEVGGRSYMTDSIPVSVAFSNFDASQPYHDIKDILPVEDNDLRYVTWGIIILTIVSLLILVYLLRKPVPKNKVIEQKYSGSLSAFDQAIKDLEELHAQKLPESGQVKAYYTGMNDILRNFVTRKTGVSVQEKTSNELGLQLKGIGMQNDAFIAIAQVLRMSDAVKFAKYVPANEDNEQSFTVFKKSIETINNLQL